MVDAQKFSDENWMYGILLKCFSSSLCCYVVKFAGNWKLYFGGHTAQKLCACFSKYSRLIQGTNWSL